MKNFKLKRGLCLLGVFIVMLSRVAVDAATYNISINKYSQEKSLWCWVACAKMCGSYYGNFYTQSNICNHVKGNTLNTTCKLTEVTDALEYATGKNVLLSYPCAFSQHVYQLKNKNACCICLKWDNNSGSHLYVVSGVKEASGPALNSLYLIDPVAGVSNTYVSYSSLINGATLASGTGTYYRAWMMN